MYDINIYIYTYTIHTLNYHNIHVYIQYIYIYLYIHIHVCTYYGSLVIPQPRAAPLSILITQSPRFWSRNQDVSQETAGSYVKAWWDDLRDENGSKKTMEHGEIPKFEW